MTGPGCWQTCGARALLDELGVLALLLAAVVHDMNHDGFTNAFHRNRLTRRALTHNDQSIQVGRGRKREGGEKGGEGGWILGGREGGRERESVGERQRLSCHSILKQNIVLLPTLHPWPGEPPPANPLRPHGGPARHQHPPIPFRSPGNRIT